MKQRGKDYTLGKDQKKVKSVDIWGRCRTKLSSHRWGPSMGSWLINWVLLDESNIPDLVKLFGLTH